MPADLRLVHGEREASGRLPPHNLELERDVIGAVFVTDDRAIVAKLRGAGLTPPHFFDPNNGRVWQAIEALADEPGGDVGYRAVQEWLRARDWFAKVGGSPYLAQLMDEASTTITARVISFARRLISLARLRNLQTQAHRIANEIYFDVGEPDDYLRGAVEGLTKAAEVSRIGGAQPFAETLRRSWQAFSAPPGVRGGYQTGLETYDAQVGGLHPSEVLLVSGKEKSGKSMLVGQWLADIASQPPHAVKADDGTEHARRWGSLIFSLDAAKTTDWAERVASADACVDLSLFRTGTATDVDREALSRAIDNVSKIPVYVDGEHVSTVGQMGARIRAVRDEMAAQGVDLAVVAIDYIQLAHGEGQNREQQIGSAMRGVIALASQPDLRGIAWVVISQTNNEGEVAQCRALAQMCDGWIHLTVDEDKETVQGWNHRERGWISSPVYPGRIDVKRGRRFAMGARAKPIPLWCCYRYTFFYCSRDDG